MISCLLHLWVLIIRQYIVLMDTALKNGIGCAAHTLRCVKTSLLHPRLSWQKLLKIHLLERAQVLSGHKAAHARAERCNARAHKLGNLPPETCSCWKANQKAWRNLTAGRLASHPPPPLLLSSVVEGISMAGAYSPGSLSILLCLSWFPGQLTHIVPWQKVFEAYAIQIVKMHSSVCLSECMCVFAYMHVWVLLQ